LLPKPQNPVHNYLLIIKNLIYFPALAQMISIEKEIESSDDEYKDTFDNEISLRMSFCKFSTH